MSKKKDHCEESKGLGDREKPSQKLQEFAAEHVYSYGICRQAEVDGVQHVG